MRKHFLILMLLTLLPFTAWAEDLSQGKIVIASTYLGYAPTCTADNDHTQIKVYNKVNVQLTKDVHFVFNGFYSDEDCTSPLTEAQVKTQNAGAIIWVKVTGIDTYENPLTASFEIKKMPLLLKGNANTKVYGTTPDPTPLYTITYVVEDIPGGVSLTGAGKAFKTPNSKITFTRAGNENVGNKELTATITEALADNYSIAKEKILNEAGDARAYFTITAKDFIAEGVGATVTITINDDDLTYTGDALHPTYVVKDKASGVTLVENTDYTVTYVDGEDNADACITAANHNIRFTGKGNYDTDKVQKTFTIAPAVIIVRPFATKEYDGDKDLLDAPADATANEAAQVPATGNGCYFKFQGFVGGNTADQVVFGDGAGETEVPAWTWNVAEDETANYGTYDLKIDNNINKAFRLDNYTFIAQKGTYTITKRDVTAAAKNDELNYGETKVFTLKTDDAEALAGAVADDYTALRNAIKVTKSNDKSTDVGYEDKYELIPEWKTDAEIAADINASTTLTDEQKIAAIAAAKAAKANYDMTPAKGYLTFKKANLAIALDESKYTLTKVYDGQPISIELDKENGLIISGLVKEEDINDINLTNLEYYVVGENTGAYKATPYVLKLRNAEAENYNITYVASSYTITQRPMTITVHDQVFVNNTVPVLNGTLYTIEDTPAEDEGLVDPVAKVFKLELDATTLEIDGAGKIQKGVGTYAAIKVVNCGAADSKFDNYDITVMNDEPAAANGRARVVATALTLDDTKDMKEALAAADGNNATITFSSRTLDAGVWYTLVLPFDITVAKFSQACGYAIVDMFDQTSNDGKVRFNLFMGNIPANTPFMFKLNGDKINLNQVVIDDVTIDYDPEHADPDDDVQFSTDGNPYITDGTNVLLGFYGKKADNKLNAGEYYLGNASDNKWKPAESDNVKLDGGRAKLVLAANAREILIEEPDGSVTAISCITADGVAVEADGWYTLNGVKLQGAPTQKGIYIRNGKKMVIK